jgi:hypothetical protein
MQAKKESDANDEFDTTISGPWMNRFVQYVVAMRMMMW